MRIWYFNYKLFLTKSQGRKVIKLKGDIKELKIMFNNNGKGNYTNKISLPKTWIAQMGVTPEQREVIVKFENNKIIIEKNE